MAYLLLRHFHSVLRWLVLSGLLFVLVRSVIFLIKPQKENSGGQKIVSISVSLMHLQILIGLILYFVSPRVIFSSESMSNPLLRFYLVEHISLMLLSAIVITFGSVYAKRAVNPTIKHLRLLLFFLFGLILVYLAIPWPWKNLSGSWI